MKKMLTIDSIVIDKDFQSRHRGLDKSHLADMIAAYEGKDAELIECPRVFEITGKGNVLTRGFHRIEAAMRIGKKTIECEVRHGYVADAILDAVAGNIGHGLRRTNEDKRRCVEMVLSVHEDWSSRRIAEAAGVHQDLVAKVREAQVSDSDTSKENASRKSKKRKGRDGKSYSSNGAGKKDHSEPGASDPSGGPKDAYKHMDDDVPDIKGVYRPLFMRNNNNHEVAIDYHGNSIPDLIGDIFADYRLRAAIVEAQDVVESFDVLLKSLNKVFRSNHFPWADEPKVEKLANQARDTLIAITETLVDGTPQICCPKCSGARCKFCIGSGYLGRGKYELHPEVQIKKRASAPVSQHLPTCERSAQTDGNDPDRPPEATSPLPEHEVSLIS
jgi:hypothetical protein